MQESPLLLTIERAAERLEVSRTTMYQLLGAGEITAVKVGRCRRVVDASLQDFVARKVAEQTGTAA